MVFDCLSRAGKKQMEFLALGTHTDMSKLDSRYLGDTWERNNQNCCDILRRKYSGRQMRTGEEQCSISTLSYFSRWALEEHK